MKLSLDALKDRAGNVATAELLNSISGGTENACHDTPPAETESTACDECQETYVQSQGSHTPLTTWLIHTILH